MSALPDRSVDAVADLADLVAWAEIAGVVDEAAADTTDRLLEGLRADWHAADADGRASLGRIVRHLTARRDALMSDGRKRPSANPVSLRDVLARLGATTLRPGQDSPILAALAGADSLVIMPTGSGKSLCFQAPAFASGGLTVVVSPLIALISDQYAKLTAAGLPVAMMASTQTADESRAALATIRAGTVRLVLCAPERFGQASFTEAVAANPVDLLAIDEAHCVAEWGHDFRPEYLRLAELRATLGARAVMALTATATPQVAAEISARLGLRDPVVMRTGFDRTNLSFDVIPLGGKGAVARKWDALLTGLHADGGTPAIVYCGTRGATDDVAKGLVDRGLSAVGYHAGMSADARNRAQDAFMSGRVDVIAATTAFGMGIDRADVRGVWHWSIPTSLEGYYQEAGRAGRDGLPGRAVMLAMRADLGRLIQFAKRDRTSAADVAALLRNLATEETGNGSFAVERDRWDDSRRLALAVAERIGAIELWPGRGGCVEGRLLVRSMDSEMDRAADDASRQAIDRAWSGYRAITGYVDARTCRRRTILDHFGDVAPGRAEGRCCDICDPLPDVAPAAATSPAVPGRARATTQAREPIDCVGDDGILFERLREWRRERADGNPAYTVCANRALQMIATQRPRDIDALTRIPGIGPVFTERHATSLLAFLGDTA